MSNTRTLDPIPEETAQLHGTLLRHRPFLVLWLIQTLSQTSQNAVNFGLLVLVQG